MCDCLHTHIFACVNEKECDSGDATKKKREISLYGEICVCESERKKARERERER